MDYDYSVWFWCKESGPDGKVKEQTAAETQSPINTRAVDQRLLQSKGALKVKKKGDRWYQGCSEVCGAIKQNIFIIEMHKAMLTDYKWPLMQSRSSDPVFSISPDEVTAAATLAQRPSGYTRVSSTRVVSRNVLRARGISGIVIINSHSVGIVSSCCPDKCERDLQACKAVVCACVCACKQWKVHLCAKTNQWRAASSNLLGTSPPALSLSLSLLD